jgi:hypothetical protein
LQEIQQAVLPPPQVPVLLTPSLAAVKVLVTKLLVPLTVALSANLASINILTKPGLIPGFFNMLYSLLLSAKRTL